MQKLTNILVCALDKSVKEQKSAARKVGGYALFYKKGKTGGQENA